MLFYCYDSKSYYVVLPLLFVVVLPLLLLLFVVFLIHRLTINRANPFSVFATCVSVFFNQAVALGVQFLIGYFSFLHHREWTVVLKCGTSEQRNAFKELMELMARSIRSGSSQQETLWDTRLQKER